MKTACDFFSGISSLSNFYKTLVRPDELLRSYDNPSCKKKNKIKYELGCIVVDGDNLR